jgi:formylglycine-generating enzyme required for sulfatase activity
VETIAPGAKAARTQRPELPSTLFALAGLLVLFVVGCSDGRDQTAECAGAAWIGHEVLAPAGPMSRDSGEFQPKEAFLEDGEIGAFASDATEITNAQFAAFVTETRYLTSQVSRHALSAHENDHRKFALSEH